MTNPLIDCVGMRVFSKDILSYLSVFPSAKRVVFFRLLRGASIVCLTDPSIVRVGMRVFSKYLLSYLIVLVLPLAKRVEFPSSG